MPSYTDITGFRNLTVMPSELVDAVESIAAGWIDAQLAYWSAQIDTRLTKRYNTPFQSPYPVALVGWLVRIVTHRAYLRLGVKTSDEQYESIKQDAQDAWSEIKEAADSNTGLFDLPLRADVDKSGIRKGGPLYYSEQSPYVWADQQAYLGRAEDENGRGRGNG